ncbi:hypothetical protein KOR34_07760 [Posidoniimonas corsicana]|uniref:Uncharacterized protein n=1 Tax=Posidoniimonas corsicana TaxID=1938618 RepID=A0A5C5VD30_9BACT|nr:hypothetical protein [Posidoniimonas corsicana]TWT35880.1 hypothetical protein KOR34_07760 [Posidoniimonas corsicana]
MIPRNTMTAEKVAEIEQMLETGARQVDVAGVAGVTASAVRTIANGLHYHQQSEEEQARRFNSTLRGWVPTLDEIARECERIRHAHPRLPVGYRSVEFEW